MLLIAGARCALIALASVFASPLLMAATFTVACDGKVETVAHGCSIRLSGQIEKGDTDRLVRVLREPLYGDWHYHRLVLNSPGGDVQEALALADLVRRALLDTTTERFGKSMAEHESWPCVSACFLVWVAGAERFSATGIDTKQRRFGLGLHRPYFSPAAYKAMSPASAADAHQSVYAVVREYLRREQVPEALIEKMLQRSSKEVYWVDESGDEFTLNGRAAWFEEMMIANCGFDPVYERESEAAQVKEIRAEHARGKRVTIEALRDKFRSYVEWRERYNDCQYKARLDAQAALRR